MAAATMASRLLGFLREVLMAHVLGGDMLMSAWTTAFRIPNLFRRILGEGALGTALVPLISHALEKEGKEAARSKFSTILFWLALLLALITVLVSVPSYIWSFYVDTERLRLALKLTPVVMPYCVFICLIGVMCSLLNSIRVFFLPALASLLLNVLLIACLFLVCPRLESPSGILDSLGVAVILSGLVEIALMLWLLKREGMLPSLERASLMNVGALDELWRLALPGLLGASALQVSVLVDTSIAMYLSDYAAAALSYSDRLIYLPIGVFAVSFGTVSLSEMSRAAAQSDIKTMLSHMLFSLRNLLFITFPMAVFMTAFSIPLIRLVYYGGKFGDAALSETAWAFMFYAYGIPAFAAVKITVSGFYARKDMRTPVLVSLVCIALNIVLSLVLMWPLKQGGIALATVISSYLNNVLLLVFLQRAIGGVPFKGILKTLALLALSSVLAVLPSLWAFKWLAASFHLPYVPRDLLPLAGASIVFGTLFMALAFAFRMEEARDFAGRLLSLASKFSKKK